jgi:hypothetical protein
MYFFASFAALREKKLVSTKDAKIAKKIKKTGRNLSGREG